MSRPSPPSSPDPKNGPDFTVSERSRKYSSSSAAPVDSNAMTDTPPPTARWGQEAPEVTLRPEVTESTVPDIRKSARSQSEVDRQRPREVPGWVGPLVGVVVFVLVLGGGIAIMVSTAALRVVTAPPEPEKVEETPEDLEGVPVRKGFRDDP